MKKLLCLFLAALLLLSVGCTAQEEVIDPPAQVTETDQDAADANGSVVSADSNDQEPVEICGEEVPALFSSVEEMIEAVVKERQAQSKDGTAQINELEALSVTYVPAKNYEDFRLWKVEVNPYYVFYYYVSEGEDIDYFDWSHGITFTVSRKSEMTMDSVCAQLEIVPDEDGFAYDAEMREMYFEQDGTVISVHVPEHMNDYDTLRKLCKVKKVEITEDALAEASWEIDEVEETDTEITEDAPAIATWDIEPGGKALWYPSVEELLQSGYFEPLTLVYTPPAEIEGFSLWNAELFFGGLIYYYNPDDPGDAPQDEFDWNRGIMFTIYQNSEVTLKSLCKDQEVSPDEDGFAYDTNRCNMYFEQDGIAAYVHVPGEPNDYETLRSLCRMEKVMVP